MFFNFLEVLFSSRTVSLALSVLPILNRAFELNKADDWVYDKLPKRIKENGTLDELDEVFKTGKEFLKACWNFFHA